jgi:YfiH family protein
VLRFSFLERFGVVAAMSDQMEGDCSFRGRADVRARFLEACGGAVGRLVCARQVHGRDVLQVDAGDAGKGGLNLSLAVGDADGLLTNAPGLPVGVTIADCVPIFLYSPTAKAGGIVHAGREGTRQNIAGHAIAGMHTHFEVDAEDVRAVIGPSAGPCCYEVSAEMADDWEATGLPRSGRHLDLWGANQDQLCKAGVARENIEISGLCTICSERFFSHRRAPGMGHNLAVFMR